LGEGVVKMKAHIIKNNNYEAYLENRRSGDTDTGRNITIKVSDLLKQAREMNRAKMDYVTLTIYEKETNPDGTVSPKGLTFLAWADDGDYEVDFDEIPEVASPDGETLVNTK
jgi:hypothetical protein